MPFEEPFYGGPAPSGFYAGTAGSVAPGLVPALWSLSIGGHVFKADWARCKRATTDVLAPTADTSAVPNEASLSRQGYWVRYGTSFHHGAGQRRFDSDTRAIIEGRTDDRFRFSTSKGLDVWTEGQATLHHDTALRKSAAGTNLRLLSVATGLYFVDGSSLYYNTAPTAGTWTAITGITGTVNDITTDGTNIYLATATGLFSGTVGGASVAIMGALSSAYQVAQVVNGRLIAGRANILCEITAANAETIIAGPSATTTVRNGSFAWSAIWAGPSRIYAAGGTTTNSEVYQVGVTDAGALTAARLATPIPPGELVRAGLFHVSLCVLTTSKGIRLAEVQQDGGLLYGPLVSAPGDTRCAIAEDRFVWFGWTNYDSASTGVGRAALDVTVSDLVPVYASDLMATAQGNTTAVARFGGLTYMAVAGAGVYGEATTYIATGTLDSGWISYGTVELKTFASIDLRHSLLAGGSVTISYIDDTGIAVPFGTSGVVGTDGPPEVITLNQIRERIRLQIVVARDSTTATPTLYRWKLMAFPVPQRAERIQFALLFYDRLDIGKGEGQYATFDTYGEYQFLIGLAGQGAIVQCQIGDVTELVRVEGVAMEIGKPTENRSWLQGTVLVDCLRT